MPRALTQKVVSNVNVILVGTVMDIHAMTSTNVSSMYLFNAQTLPTVLTSTADSTANVNRDSPPMTVQHQSLVMTSMNVLMVVTHVIQTMVSVTTTMVALNVAVKMVGLLLVESPTRSAPISMNVRSLASTIVIPTQSVTTMMVLSHVLVSMVLQVMVLMAIVLKTLSNLLTNVQMDHIHVTSLPLLARILMLDTSVTVRIATCLLMMQMLVSSTSTHVIAKLI